MGNKVGANVAVFTELESACKLALQAEKLGKSNAWERVKKIINSNIPSIDAKLSVSEIVPTYY